MAEKRFFMFVYLFQCEQLKNKQYNNCRNDNEPTYFYVSFHKIKLLKIATVFATVAIKLFEKIC